MKRVIIKAVSLIILALNPLVAAAEALRQSDVIDWHVHVAGLGHKGSGCYVNKVMRENFRFGFFMKWMDVSHQELETHGDPILVKKLNDKIERSKYVDAAVILAMDGVIDPDTGQMDRDHTLFYVPNDYVAREAAKYPGLLFGASINPRRDDAVERLIEADRQGAVLVKWLPSTMDIDPADRRFVPFYKKMAELEMPLLSHTGKERSLPGARDELADPLRLKLPLSLGVIVIAAHLGTTGKSEGQDNFERILPMFDQYPNFYADISSLTLLNKVGYLAKALRVPGLTKRMIYGSDWPLQYFPLVSPWYHVNYIGIGSAWRISGIDNRWDRDVMTLKAFGVPHSVFLNRVGKLGRAEH